MADGNNFGGNQPTRDRHALGDFRAHLVAEVQPTATKAPRLSVYYHKNRVVVEVRTNVPADMNGRERGIIRAELDPATFFAFLAGLRRVIERPTGDGRPEHIKIKRPDFNKSNGGEPVVDSQIVYGKNQEGVVFMSLLSYNKERPRIMFPFHPGKWVEFVGQDGTPKSAAEVSEVYALGKLAEWENLVPHYLYDRFVAETFERGGQRGGGGQPSGGGSGGGDMRTEARKEEAPNWDDLPF